MNSLHNARYTGDGIAILSGYTKQVSGQYMGETLTLLIKPETDISTAFRAWDTKTQSFMRIGGWNNSFNASGE